MTDLNKRLCRKLGMCWHEWEPYGLRTYWCKKCGYYDQYKDEDSNPNFSTPSGIVLLLEKMMEREDFSMFIWKIGGVGESGSTTMTYDKSRYIWLPLITDKTGRLAKLCDEWLPEVKEKK